MPDKRTVMMPDIKTQAGTATPSLSPDGKWMAFMSNANAANSYRIFVEPFPATGAR